MAACAGVCGHPSRRALRALLRMRTRSLTPHRDGRSALHHRPFVLVDTDDGVAVRAAALPLGAEALFGELPGPLAFLASLVLRLADHLAVGRKRQFEFRPGRRGGGERLSVQEFGLDFLGRELGRCERSAAHKNRNSKASKNGTHLKSPARFLEPRCYAKIALFAESLGQSAAGPRV